jgi:hypothetical protein
MPIPTSKEELTALFRELGAKEPEQWAHSQVAQGYPQLLRFLFLKSAWNNIPNEGETTWIEHEIERARINPDIPYAGLGLSLARCREKGVTAEELNEIARCLRAQMLFSIGYLIDGPTSFHQSLDDISWGLFQTNENGEPIGQQISGLHESVLEFDLTGREMRPKLE